MVTQSISKDFVLENQIDTRPSPACYLCGATGELLYENLKDRLFGAPGTWNLRRCPEPGCGLLWIDPTPSEADIGKAYKNYFTHAEVLPSKGNWPRRVSRFIRDGYWAGKYGYGGNRIGRWPKILGALIKLHPGLSAELDFRVMYAGWLPNGRLLDVGCGSGLALQGMLQLGWQVQGVDFDPKAVEIAQKKGLDVRLGSLEAQAYPSDHFDVITMSHLIEHVHDPLSLLRECRRLLRPGGHLVVVTPNSESWGHRKFKATWMHLDPPRHLHIFNEQSLRMLLGFANLRLVSLRSTIRDTDGVFIGSRSIARTGQHRMERSHHTRFRRFWGRGMQFAEWMLLKVKPNSGEEIALVGAK